jgi:predicted nucleotide-binding protein
MTVDVEIPVPATVEDDTDEPDGTAEPKRRRTRVAKAKNYPATPLEKVLRLPNAIRDNSRGSSAFREVLSDSAEYGLTNGTYKSESISLTELGLALVRPRDESEQKESIRRAALKPAIFARLYKALNQTKWPADRNLENILVRDYGVPEPLAPEARSVANANALFAGILQDLKGGQWVVLNADAERQADEAVEAAEEGLEAGDEEVQAAEEHESPLALDVPAAAQVSTASIQGHSVAASGADAAIRARVFISHSKNPGILEQIKTILDFGQFVPVVAEEEETPAIPVPEKVLSAMRGCGSAVISVSADESERHVDGTYGTNPNVLIEIGAALALYDRRVVLVVDKRVELPSNLQGLYRCEYEGDELGWTAGMKLQKALANFRER